MIRDFIYYWREYGFKWAWLYLQTGSETIDKRLAFHDNDCQGTFNFDKMEYDCDCWELIS